VNNLLLAEVLSLGIYGSILLLLRLFKNLSPAAKSWIYLLSLIITPLVFVITFLGGTIFDPRECMSFIRLCVALGTAAFSDTS